MKYLKHSISRRDLIKRFGITAFMLHPILRSMAWAAGSEISKAPRLITVFKGGGFVPDSFFPADINSLSGKVIEPLKDFSKDLILFKNLNMGNGDYKDEEGRHYGDEHGGGMNICFTGGRVYGYDPNRGDSYYWGTYDMSVDQRVAGEYKTRSDLSHLAFESLQLGVGVTSIDRGQIFISHKAGARGQSPQANGLPAIQNPATVYNMIVNRIMTMCQGAAQQPGVNNNVKIQMLKQKLSVVDFQIEQVKDAKRLFGIEGDNASKLDGLFDSLRDVERQVNSELSALGGAGGNGKSCPSITKPSSLTDSQQEQLNIDVLKGRYDLMTQLLKLAFEWDLTRVASYMFTTGSNEQTYPGGGAPDTHHSYAHGHNISKLAIMDKFHAQKLSDLLKALKGIDDNGISGLYNSTVIMGMDTWNGPINGSLVDHSKSNMPFILAGQGGGRFQTGRIIDAKGRAHNDLLISALQASGIQTNVFGKSQYCKGALV